MGIASDFTSDIKRFWANVDRRGPHECWPWLGEINNMGYGRLSFYRGGKQRRMFAHRIALIIAGHDLSDEDRVLHSCDNPPCCNPSHLIIGTQRDNVRDALSKGRLNLSGLDLAPTRLKAGAERKCSFIDCDDRHEARGMCNRHYLRWRRQSVMQS